MDQASSSQFDFAANRHIQSLEDIQRAAQEAEQRLREAIEVLPEGIVFIDAEGRYILWNEQYAQIYAASADLLEPGVRLADTLRIGVARGDYPEAKGREEEWLTERLALLENPGVRHEQRLANGRVIMIEERKTASGGTIGLRVDITELKEREQKFRLLFEDNPVPLLVYHASDERFIRINAAAREHFGYTGEELQLLPAATLFEADEWAEARKMLALDNSEKERFWRQRHRDGSRLESVLFTRRTSVEGQDATIVSVFDVTERRRIEARIAHMARYDELTGLANRAHYREQLHDLMARPRKGEAVRVALVDLDHFKTVNDTYGHMVGDAVLASASRRMEQLIPRNALLSRIGGDEFAIIFRNASIDLVEAVSRALIATLSTPFQIDDHLLHIGATIGIASSPADTTDAETLLRYADLALYSAKSKRRGTLALYHTSMDAAAQEKSALETDFRKALKSGQLDVHYQPLIELNSGAVQGYEALVRWQHPQRGMISPEVFIPMAEEMGLIEQIGQFVLSTACKVALTWPDNVNLSVNVSPIQFRNGSILNAVIHALAASGLPAQRLELEITEAVLMDKGRRTMALIRELRALGVGLSMDDFGTGYSSLRYLLSYPFTKIKIDKSFILNMEDVENSRAVIRAVIGLGKSLGMTVTAEGIEREDVRDYLRAEGCMQGQGYLFGRAEPAEALGPPAAGKRDAA